MKKGTTYTFKLLCPRIWELKEELLHDVRHANVDTEADLEEDHDSKEHCLRGHAFCEMSSDWRACT
jgi:hypothetical protein